MKEEDFPDWLKEQVLENATFEPDACIMCEMETETRGVFVPFNQLAWGATAERKRVLVYPLCDSCYADCDQSEIEDKLVREWFCK